MQYKSFRLKITWKTILWLGMIIILMIQPVSVHADDGGSNHGRKTTISSTIKVYQWQLKFWSDDSVACSFSVDHEGQPTDEEIQTNCTYQQFDTWKNTSDCDTANGKSKRDCSGVYLVNLNSTPLYKTMVVSLPPPSVWLSMTGCDYVDSDDYCTGKPSLLLTGQEPLPNEQIKRITGNWNGQSFVCNGEKCAINLETTSNDGIRITFQAESSFGDKTQQYTAFARVIPVDGTEDSYYVDILSTQWIGKSPPSCSEVWQAFPESVDLPVWLQTPVDPSEMDSSKTLFYLAASLIKNEVVDASSCPNGGLENEITANECGVTVAGPEVHYWQNQFNEEIITVAKMDSVPANLLKNIFIRESQLWPGIYEKIEEVGFGHLTENGADTTLLWNREFYNSFCPLVITQNVCDQGFAQLSKEHQNILVGALMQRSNAACADCEKGIDLTKADFSIHIFAETLKANCSQVNQEIRNMTQKSPREVSSYSDLWRFTLLNYNAGSGCLSNALYRTSIAGSPIDWEHVAANLTEICQPAVNYVIDITGGDSSRIEEFSTLLPTPTKPNQPTNTPTITITPTATMTFTPTPTINSVSPTHEITSSP